MRQSNQDYSGSHTTRVATGVNGTVIVNMSLTGKMTEFASAILRMKMAKYDPDLKIPNITSEKESHGLT